MSSENAKKKGKIDDKETPEMQILINCIEREDYITKQIMLSEMKQREKLWNRISNIVDECTIVPTTTNNKRNCDIVVVKSYDIRKKLFEFMEKYAKKEK
ncbi:MAG: hypothetical protein NUV80_01085 [Candidatus Berkelbacteria bacterium]|nr:hypothetical protein [Candidatus Berkelbacteria bacterium]